MELPDDERVFLPAVAKLGRRNGKEAPNIPDSFGMAVAAVAAVAAVLDDGGSGVVLVVEGLLKSPKIGPARVVALDDAT